jgi:ADP-ribosylglycohydrolase
MSYPKIPDFQNLSQLIIYYSKYKHEFGAELDGILEKMYSDLNNGLIEIKNLPEYSNADEPSEYSEILKLRPEGPRKMVDSIPIDYDERLKGAFLSRIAGCILGAPVEFHSIDDMKSWAKYNNEVFPPIDYWKTIKQPYEKRYEKSDFIEYTKDGITKVPVDDDLVYTVLNLLLVEKYGIDFTTSDVGDIWKTYLPHACTAEEVALNNIKNGVSADQAAIIDNPYVEWIGADIRSDAFAYIAPGYPEKAAKMAYYDAYLSHRRNGIYGEMFFAAAQSAAFVVDDSIEAIRIGLTEIPKNCQLAKDIRWALDISPNINNYLEARSVVEERFKHMEHAHTNNNACLTVLGLAIGNNDITKVISETVAMGMDNDCTAATAGSIVGAVSSFSKLEEHWYNNFNDTLDTYLIGKNEFKISELLIRFKKQAKIVLK